MTFFLGRVGRKEGDKGTHEFDHDDDMLMMKMLTVIVLTMTQIIMKIKITVIMKIMTIR